MLSREENELLTRTGPGTPMGDVMRRYWMPAALSSELPAPDCPPVRVKLLGEKLVAFRDTTGRVGLLDELCAHRRASLFLGRNEECGLRCVYHGWKYDVEGNCVDMPNEPPESNFKEKVRLKAYPTAELGGVIWAYMGPEERKPALPKFEWTQVPEGHRYVTKMWQECNWLQSVEGAFDNVHVSFLHRNLTTDTTKPGVSPHSSLHMWSPTVPKLPEMEVEQTDYGCFYAVTCPVRESENLVIIQKYVMPFHQLRSTTALGELAGSNMVEGHMWVPMDDENCMDYSWRYAFGDAAEKEMMGVIERQRGRGSGERTADLRKLRNKDNNWLIDRQVQKTETFTGIEGINIQDHAVQESMGPISDRTGEHLGSNDKIIIVARLLLSLAVRTVQDGGDPPGVSPNYRWIRPTLKILPRDVPWWEDIKEEMHRYQQEAQP